MLLHWFHNVLSVYLKCQSHCFSPTEAFRQCYNDKCSFSLYLCLNGGVKGIFSCRMSWDLITMQLWFLPVDQGLPFKAGSFLSRSGWLRIRSKVSVSANWQKKTTFYNSPRFSCWALGINGRQSPLNLVFLIWSEACTFCRWPLWGFCSADMSASQYLRSIWKTEFILLCQGSLRNSTLHNFQIHRNFPNSCPTNFGKWIYTHCILLCYLRAIPGRLICYFSRWQLIEIFWTSHFSDFLPISETRKLMTSQHVDDQQDKAPKG